ncbi:hypothetical protein [Mycolicibacterium goodii]|uniref:hypothetical protein n=1 Tax=Mycolicibacterium goodii TaxID=134601 RepID=UPI001BDD6B92|nr:hypothetical protein [Mycolicibacterium goodii]MBU8838967.1 hypothetical protein [Mycolicibacterium goodii]
MHWYQQDPLDVEGWHDQNADTGLLPHGYWALSLAEDRLHWRLRLWEQNEALDEIINEPYLGTFPTEAAAKAFADDCEHRRTLPR